ncbi:MAG TPA: PEP/pyruvate-binding domain-containing protein [Candidatus Sulfomarinibacteraceae bacterium]|nr:PEP/pyruvate-binding domain-containing protein [Candidatus Sulfomarinibacteraceae bacterium]
MSKDPLPRFDREFFEGASPLTVIGDGEIGGKASGLVQISDEVLARIDPEAFPHIEISVPRAVILATGVFDSFIARNGLAELAFDELSDDRIAHAFQQAELPAEFVGDLRALISGVHSPLAIRSSSLLEDALDHPFAGVYGTKMIPNNEIEEDARFSQLVEAIRFVYATTFFAAAKSYMASICRSLVEEKMGVIVQEIVGQRAHDRFYPCVSGVARSHNYYPTGHAGPSDGVVSLALGLGKTIVDGGRSWSYSPAYPKAPPPFNDIGELLKNTQTRFWAVNMGEPPPHDPIRETEYLVEASLEDAEADGALRHLVSTYDPGSDRLNPGLDARGARALTFAPLLGSRMMPFNDLFRRLLDASEDVVGGPVELEFALNLHRPDALPARFGFLQIRPMMAAGERVEVTVGELTGDGVVLATEIALGNGIRDDLTDVVFVHPDAFDPAATPVIAKELEQINRTLVAENRQYLLIGFGRWGTSDPPLGIPVAWGQISGARVIVEATLPDVQPDLSQGSHFFHNLLSFHVLYLSIEHHGPYGIDWQWLTSQPVVQSAAHATHVRLPAPLTVKVDGATGRGVITRNEES